MWSDASPHLPLPARSSRLLAEGASPGAARAGVRRASTSASRRASSSASSATRGCGKTTILNVLAGLDSASAGHVFMDGREVAGPEPGARRGVPGPCADALAHGAQQHRLRGAQQWPDWSRAQVDEHVREVRRAWWACAGAIDKKPSAAVRRHEAARGHRARLRHPAQDAAARRALRRARRADARHHPGRAAAHRAPRRSRPSS